MQMYTLVLVAALTAGAGCKFECGVDRRTSNVHASVQCDLVAGVAVACTVQQLEGTADVEICWDFKVMCDSGASLTAPRTCVHVAQDGTTRKTIPYGALAIQGTCTGERHATLSAVTIDGAPAQR